MKRRMIAAASIGLVVGLVAWLSSMQSRSQCQAGQDAGGWEYKS